MFSGIIESTGKITHISESGTNKTFTVLTDISKESYIDQSIAHNGVCLTVVQCDDESYQVTAIKETLDVTNLGQLAVGDHVNLERCMLPNTRLDGHMVQGHIDTITKCLSVESQDGSWVFEFELPADYKNLIVPKGSVCLNGISLTVVEPNDKAFKVAIIPYTYEHTNLKNIKAGDQVNIEFDIIGKYVAKHLALRNDI